MCVSVCVYVINENIDASLSVRVSSFDLCILFPVVCNNGKDLLKFSAVVRRGVSCVRCLRHAHPLQAVTIPEDALTSGTLFHGRLHLLKK